MFGYIWVGMIIFSLIVGLFSGNAETVALAAAEGAQSGVTMTLELLGIIAFWNGIMKIAEEGGVINILSRLRASFSLPLLHLTHRNSQVQKVCHIQVRCENNQETVLQHHVFSGNWILHVLQG